MLTTGWQETKMPEMRQGINKQSKTGDKDKTETMKEDSNSLKCL